MPRLNLLAVGLTIVGAPGLQAQGDAALTFTQRRQNGVGLYSPAAVFTEPDRVVIKGFMLLPDSCHGIRASLQSARQGYVELLLEGTLITDAGCIRMIEPTLYQAAVGPLQGGDYQVVVRYRAANGDESLLADVRNAKVPYYK